MLNFGWVFFHDYVVVSVCSFLVRALEIAVMGTMYHISSGCSFFSLDTTVFSRKKEGTPIFV